MTYSQQLRDPRWQRKRLEVMERDNFTCQHCHSSDKFLNVHHKIYIHGREPWEYEFDIFITLCEDCHKAEEADKRAFNLLIRFLVAENVSYCQIFKFLEPLFNETKSKLNERLAKTS